MEIQTRLYIADDLWTIEHQPEFAGKRLELVRGELREMCRPGGEHGEITVGFAALLLAHVRPRKLGRITTETGYRLATDPDTVRGPDVAFVAMVRAPEGLPAGIVPFAPDLAVEVVSPNDKPADLLDQVQDYLGAGTTLVVVLYPEERKVDVYRLAETGEILVRRLKSGDVLDLTAVIPGFQVDINTLFER